MHLKELLDPQGKGLNSSLNNLGLTQLHDVRIGKHISLNIEAPNREEAENITREACKKLLANPVMEAYDFTLTD